MSFGFSLSTVEFTPFDPVIRQYVYGKDDDPGKEMWRRGTAVWAAARGQVGVDTGSLRDAIRVNWSRDALGYYIDVSANHRLAVIHHEGTRPHQIRPRTHKALRMPTAGGMVYATRVNHPGTRPNRFLTDPLRLAV